MKDVEWYEYYNTLSHLGGMSSASKILLDYGLIFIVMKLVNMCSV